MKIKKNNFWWFFTSAMFALGIGPGMVYAEQQAKAENQSTKTSPTKPKEENKISKGLALELIIPQKVKQGTPIAVLIRVWNKGETPLKFVYPYGADKNGLFSFELSEVTTGAKWEVLEHSVRGLVKDKTRTIPKNSAVEHEPDSLRYKKDNDWQTTLPVGRYKMVASYNPQKAILAEDRVGSVIQSPSVEFTVE